MSLIGSLSLRERGPDRLVLAVPVYHRVFFGVLTVLTVFILCSGVLFEGETTVLLPRNTVAGLLVLVAVFGLVYEDRWTFDRAAGRVQNRFGALFLARLANAVDPAILRPRGMAGGDSTSLSSPPSARPWATEEDP